MPLGSLNSLGDGGGHGHLQCHTITKPQPQLHLPGESAPPTIELGQVNWAEEFAVVLDLGEQPTGGYAVRSEEVRVMADVITIKAHVQRPAPGQLVTQAITHPWCLITVPLAGLKGVLTVNVEDQTGAIMAKATVQLADG